MVRWSVRAYVAVALFACVSCSDSDGQRPVELTELPVFTVRVAQRSLEQVMERGEALVAVFGGGSDTKAELRSRLLEASRQGGDRWTVQLPGALLFWYDRRRDDMRLEVDALAPRPADKGADAARSVARGTFDALVGRKLVNRRHHDVAQAAVTAVPNATQEWTLEYVVVYARRINGVPVSGLGLEVTVEASGKLRAVTVGGPTVDSRFEGGVEIPSAPPSVVFRRVVSPDEARARFTEENPMARLESLELTYAPPSRTPGATYEIRPYYVARFEVTTVRDGGATSTRRSTVGYSIEDLSAPVVSL